MNHFQALLWLASSECISSTCRATVYAYMYLLYRFG
jgi:hypothetical protein